MHLTTIAHDTLSLTRSQVIFTVEIIIAETLDLASLLLYIIINKYKKKTKITIYLLLNNYKI
jgi:hypothetical protein